MKSKDSILHGLSGAIRVTPMWCFYAFLASCAKDVFISFAGTTRAEDKI